MKLLKKSQLMKSTAAAALLAARLVSQPGFSRTMAL